MRGHTNLLEILVYYAEASPAKIAYQFICEKGCQTITYKELDTKAKALAALLQQYPSRGERAMLLLPPGLDYIIALFGCLYAGMIAVPAYPPRRNRHSERMSAIVEDAQAKFILTHQIFLNECPYTPYQFVLDTLDESLAEEYRPVSVNTDDLAFLQYTSGSTSTPKGVMVSHRNALTNLEVIASYFSKDCVKMCCWLPPYHDLGLIGGIFYPLFLNASVTLMSPTYFLQSPLRWLEIMSREKTSITAAPNFAYDYCVKKISPEQIQTLDLSNWHYALNGSEPICFETIQRFCKTFAPAGFSPRAMRPVYGLAEATLIVSAASQQKWEKPLIVSKSALEQKKIVPVTAHHSEAAVSLISCGEIPPVYDIRIVEPQTLQMLPEDEIGEVWVSGPSIAQGYYGNPELSKATFQAKLPSLSENNYLRTGDLGFLHQGELYIAGRSKDLIIIRGLNHYPHDIELTVMQCHPSLQPYATAAFTVEHNGEEQLIVMQEIARIHLARFDADVIINAIRSSVLSEHGLQVQGIALLKTHAMPKTSSGKIQRFACREAYITNNVPIVANWKKTEKQDLYLMNAEPILKNSVMLTAEDIREWMQLWLVNRFKVSANNIELNSTLAEFGLDSIAAAELAADLQNWLNKPVDPMAMLEQRSLADLIQFLMAPITISKTGNNTSDNVNCVAFPCASRTHSLVTQSKHPLEDVAKNIYFVTTESVSQNTTIIDEKQYINYAGYNYLGMSGDPFVTDAAIKAIKEYGTSVSASRIASGQKPLHAQLEKGIANLIGVENCLVYSSGHATNVSVITHLFGPRDLIVHDVLCHNSILQGAIFSGAARIAFPHNDYVALEKILETHREQYKKVLIVSEGIFSMDGDIPDVLRLIALKARFETFLMLDEAHSIGTLGKTGGGIREYFDLDPKKVDIWMGTLSKAFASCGGYIAGSSELIEHLKYNAAGFVYSAGISPANTAAALAALQLMKQQPERVTTLQKRHTLLLSLLKNAGIPTGNSNNTPIIPIVTGDEQAAIELSLSLKAHNIYAVPIVYPAVEKGLARVRLFINCLHTEEQLYYTVQTIKETCESKSRVSKGA